MFDLPSIEVGQNYRLYFDTLLSQGRPPFIVINHDNDPLDSAGNPVPAVKSQIESSGNPSALVNINLNYTPVLNATAARFSLILIPSDSNTIFQPSLTEVKFKNIGIEKIPDKLVLENTKTNLSTHEENKADISWKKINPTVYEVSLGNKKTPFTMVFSETFHPSWTIVDSSGKVLDLPHFSIDGFANAWSIENYIPQKIYIKFILQGAKGRGILVSALMLPLVIGIVVALDYKKKSSD